MRGPPLGDEPGLGALTLPGFLREVTMRFAPRLAVAAPLGKRRDRWTYVQLWSRAVEVARALAALGIGKDGRVGILMTNRPEWLSAFFGVALAGGVAVPLSTFCTASELDHLLGASCVSVLIFENEVPGKSFPAMLAELEPAIAIRGPGHLQSMRYPFLRHLVSVDAQARGMVESWPGFLANGRSVGEALVEATAANVRPTDAAAIFFSSGSTARPKGIIHAQRGVAIQLWRWGRMFDLGEDARAWTPNGFFWSGNFGMVIGGTFSRGGAVILQPVFAPAESLSLMEAERVNFPMVWPHQSKQLEEAANWHDVDLSAMRYVDPSTPLGRHPTIPPTGFREPQCAYGSTETFTITTGFPRGTPGAEGDSKGEVLPGNTLRIVDPDGGSTLRRGESGEIAVKGPTLMSGYLGVPVEEALDAEGFYRTGDGGRLDDAGRLYFEGRLTTIIKTGGANVSPLEVEAVLEAFPGVKAARAIGVPDDLLGEMVVGCVVPLEGVAVDAAEIRAFARERLASYKVPRRILLMSAQDIELTGSAKIRQDQLRKLAIDRLVNEQAGFPAA
jgi:fatty-acyl-CoA synthase